MTHRDPAPGSLSAHPKQSDIRASNASTSDGFSGREEKQWNAWRTGRSAVVIHGDDPVLSHAGATILAKILRAHGSAPKTRPP